MSARNDVDTVLKRVPAAPGVYFFKDKEDAIIYIGKAKSLRNRIRSYFRQHTPDWKIETLMVEQRSFDYVLTKSELEALLLEAQLIRDHKPKYNVLLKHGNPFLYIVFTDGPMPEMKLVRVKKEKGTYFGPFLHKKEARSGYSYLMRTFRLKRCNKSIEGGCLDYHLGLCAGTCLSTFSQEEYNVRLGLAQQTLEGKFKQVCQTIEQCIVNFNTRREFEKAHAFHRYLQNLEPIFATIKAKCTPASYEAAIFAATTSRSTVYASYVKGLEQLQKILQLPTMPRVIDCFDISHFQSTYLVGSCIRFTEGVPDTKGFRRFRIKTLSEQNDYAALYEIVSRRYKKSQDALYVPDVVLIDGGKGQLNAVKEILPQALFISLAKREERLFTPFHAEGLVLDIKTELGQLLIALRDYAHGFAVNYHTLLRTKGMRLST